MKYTNCINCCYARIKTTRKVYFIRFLTEQFFSKIVHSIKSFVHYNCSFNKIVQSVKYRFTKVFRKNGLLSRKNNSFFKIFCKILLVSKKRTKFFFHKNFCSFTKAIPISNQRPRKTYHVHSTGLMHRIII